MEKSTILTLAILLMSLAAYAEGKIKIACIGNSVTYGYGHSAPAESSYPVQLGKLLGEATLGVVE